MYPDESQSFQNVAHGKEFGAELEMGFVAEIPTYLCEMDGAYAQKAFFANTCFSTKENTFVVALHLRRPPAKQQGQGSQRQPQRSLAMESRELGEKKASVALLSKAVFVLQFVPGGESTFPDCSSQNLVWAVGEMGPRC